MENIEQLFILYSNEYQSELEEHFYQSELNTHEYFDPESFKEIVQVAYLNLLVSEYYMEYSYKYLNEYFKINNSLKILGTIENDPQIKTCVEIIKDIIMRVKDYKVDMIVLLNQVFPGQKMHMTPSNETMLYTINFGNKYKKPQTAVNMIEFAIRALVRAEGSLGTLDHITSFYFDKHMDILDKFDLEDIDIHNFEEKSEWILDAFLDLKLNHLIQLKI
jgi:hypothetical protein